MNINKLWVAAVAAATLFSVSCSNDEEQVLPSDRTPMNISVSDAGYTSADSRSMEEGLTTMFTAGDKIGVYAVQNGAVVVENACFTAEQKDGKLAWTASVELPAKDVLFFAYYPYTASAAAVNASATRTKDFFKQMIAGWSLTDQQGNHEAYTAGDLMTAKGEVTASGIAFNMAHMMSLVVVKFPAEAREIMFEGASPYMTAEGYRMVMKPSSETDFLGTYKANGAAEIFSFTAKAPMGGMYKTFNVKAE